MECDSPYEIDSADEIPALISNASGVPETNIIVTAVHTHEAPYVEMPAMHLNEETKRLNQEKTAAWSAAVRRALLDSINLA